MLSIPFVKANNMQYIFNTAAMHKVCMLTVALLSAIVVVRQKIIIEWGSLHLPALQVAFPGLSAYDRQTDKGKN